MKVVRGFNDKLPFYGGMPRDGGKVWYREEVTDNYYLIGTTNSLPVMTSDFEKFYYNPNDDGRIISYLTSKSGVIYGAGEDFIYKSVDNGLNWTLIYDFKETVNCFKYIPQKDMFIASINDHIYLSSDNCLTFDEIYEYTGFNEPHFFHIEYSNYYDSIFFLITNTLYRYDFSTSNIISYSGPATMTSLSVELNGQYIYVNLNSGNLYRGSISGGSFNSSSFSSNGYITTLAYIDDLPDYIVTHYASSHLNLLTKKSSWGIRANRNYMTLFNTFSEVESDNFIGKFNNKLYIIDNDQGLKEIILDLTNNNEDINIDTIFFNGFYKFKDILSVNNFKPTFNKINDYIYTDENRDFKINYNGVVYKPDNSNLQLKLTDINFHSTMLDIITKFGENINFNWLDTSEVTDMSYLFGKPSSSDPDTALSTALPTNISTLDMSSVTTLEGFFANNTNSFFPYEGFSWGTKYLPNVTTIKNFAINVKNILMDMSNVHFDTNVDKTDYIKNVITWNDKPKFDL